MTDRQEGLMNPEATQREKAASVSQAAIFDLEGEKEFMQDEEMGIESRRNRSRKHLRPILLLRRKI